MHHWKQEKTCSIISRQISCLIKAVVNGFSHFAKCKKNTTTTTKSKTTCSTFNTSNIGIIVYQMSKTLYQHQHHNIHSVIKKYLIHNVKLTLLLRVSTAGNFLTMNFTADSRFLSIRQEGFALGSPQAYNEQGKKKHHC